MRITNIITGITYACVFITIATANVAVNAFVTATAATAGLAGIYLDAKRWYPIPRRLLNLIALLTVVGAAVKINTQDPLPQIMEVVLLLCSIKLLEEKRFRDYMQIYLLCLFSFAGAAFFTLSIRFLLYFLLLFFLISTSAIFLTVVSFSRDENLNRRTGLKVLSFSLLVPLSALPLAVIIFVILPRPQEPIFSFLQRKGAVSGFSDKVLLGEVSRIQSTDTTVMRVKVRKLPEEYLYWRGITLEYFDGRIWKRETRRIKRSTYTTYRDAVRQEIYLEPYGEEYLFALDTPLTVRAPKVRFLSDYTFKLTHPVLKKMHYKAVSYPQIRPQDIPDGRYLQLPPNLPENVKVLAKKLCAKNAESSVKNVLSYFQKNFTHTLTGLPSSEEPLKEFLELKRGNCEFFASAAAVILRMCGIPARLVAGFRGGEYNELGGYYRISQKQAHVWVEAYEKGTGWVRVDPTPRARTEAKRSSLLSRIRKAADLINYYWVMFVVNYDLQTQLSLLKKVRISLRRMKGIARIRKNKALKMHGLRVSALLATVLAITLLVLKGLLHKEPEEKRLVRKFLTRMEKLGYKKRESEGLEEFARRIPEKRMREKALTFAKEVEPVIYHEERLTPEKRKALIEIIDSL